MSPCQLTIAISSIACIISEGLSEDELAIYAAFFTQLGDSLATIAVQKNICEKEKGI